ncbi:MAG TPA: class I SAM-dependent methyltransferase, partial [Acidimicrobiia bacterium]|nr:class I SAM-dependent methyltransferase [Acidimicrobiia bacterium]
MHESPSFRPDLYRGTAADYDAFRLPYPRALLDDLCRRVAPSGSGRLLDLACGPGTLTFALNDRFAEVWAVDQEPGAVEFARHKSERLGVKNVRWMTARAETVDAGEAFELVTIGTAFHRLDRRQVAGRSARWLRAGGHLALLWSDTPVAGPAPWQQVLAEIFVDWSRRLEADDRIPPDLQTHLDELPHATVLEEAGFSDVRRYEFTEVHDWTVDALIGLMYSTSVLSRVVLADRAGAFEADMRQRL